MNKTCTKCNQTFPLTSEFWDARKTAKDGFRNRCRNCRREYFNNLRIENYDEMRTREINYEKENRDYINQEHRRRYVEHGYDKKKKKYVENNKEIIRNKAKQKRLNRSEEEILKESKKQREYYEKNREKIIKQNCEYIKKKLAEDIQWMLKFRLRGRIKDALKKNKKLAKSFDLIGADVEFVRIYLESQFTNEMTWDNHGAVWHIDHIKPICSFDLTILEEQKKCFHYTNLRPLLAKDNLKKSAEDKLLSIRNKN